jgi:hypothetical protein
MMQRLRAHAGSTKRRHQYRERKKHREPLIVIYVCVSAHARARQVLSDCIDLRRRLRRITFEFIVVDPHNSNNTRRLY